MKFAGLCGSIKHYSIHTERTYCDWIRRFILFHKMQDRAELFIESEKKIEEYLTHLAIEGNVAPATQYQRGSDQANQLN